MKCGEFLEQLRMFLASQEGLCSMELESTTYSHIDKKLSEI
jgi:hypothetical protein